MEKIKECVVGEVGIKENVVYRGGIIGYILNGKYYTKREDRHFFRIFGGFGVSQKVLAALRDRGIDEITIFYGDIRYITDIDLFLKEGFHYKDIDDDQFILPLNQFKVSE